MQRLFTTFPNAWPGAGLLLMRLALGWLFLTSLAAPGSSSPAGLPHWLGWGAALSVALGLYTPLAASTCVLLTLLCLPASPVADALIAFGISLALIGPGAWSLDSRIFGRKRIDVTF